MEERTWEAELAAPEQAGENRAEGQKEEGTPNHNEERKMQDQLYIQRREENLSPE